MTDTTITTHTPTDTTTGTTTGTTERDERYDRGIDVLHRINGKSVVELANALEGISPELGYQTVAWAYGDIYSRPGLAPRDRQLLTLGMLTSQGGEESELNAHIPLALEVGLTPDEIVEAFLHTAVYCGFPRAINATLVAKKIFADRGLSTSAQKS